MRVMLPDHGRIDLPPMGGSIPELYLAATTLIQRGKAATKEEQRTAENEGIAARTTSCIQFSGRFQEPAGWLYRGRGAPPSFPWPVGWRPRHFFESVSVTDSFAILTLVYEWAFRALWRSFRHL